MGTFIGTLGSIALFICLLMQLDTLLFLTNIRLQKTWKSHRSPCFSTKRDSDPLAQIGPFKMPRCYLTTFTRKQHNPVEKRKSNAYKQKRCDCSHLGVGLVDREGLEPATR